MAVQFLGEILDKGTLDVYVRIMRFKEGGSFDRAASGLSLSKTTV